MLHPETDPDWRTHVPALVQWVETVFAVPQFNANTIKQQIVFAHAMGSHTARYAAVNALYSELTGDVIAREKAYRALNWATYMISGSPQGQIIDGPSVGNVWFTDGYADYIRHFMRAMGAVPQWAPNGASPMTRATSVVTSITYRPGEILYTTADPDGTVTLKIGFTPAEVTADGSVLPQHVDVGEPFADSQVPFLITSHSQVLTGLSPATVYHYRVLSRDAAGNPAVSDDRTFTTSVADTTPPSVIHFNDLPSTGGSLNGQYPTGVVDWGNNAWWRSGPWGQFTTNSVSFTSSGVSASFRFITPRRVVSVKAFNGGATTSTVTLACAGNPSTTTAVAPNQLVTITTAWSTTCSVVTVGSSIGWDTNFDDITHSAGP